jgi:hypothetical protein
MLMKLLAKLVLHRKECQIESEAKHIKSSSLLDSSTKLIALQKFLSFTNCRVKSGFASVVCPDPQLFPHIQAADNLCPDTALFVSK